jgi:hypothetical protein
MITIVPITLHLDERKAEVHGWEIKLTTREIDLLAYLMRNKNRVLTREIILNKVWGFAYSCIQCHPVLACESGSGRFGEFYRNGTGSVL